MDYRLPLLNSASQIDETNNQVCRKGIAIAYGLSVKSLQAYSIAKRRKTLGSFLHSRKEELLRINNTQLKLCRSSCCHQLHQEGLFMLEREK
jgi:hypothetical protein